MTDGARQHTSMYAVDKCSHSLLRVRVWPVAFPKDKDGQQQAHHHTVTFLLGPFSSPPLPPPTELARPSVRVLRLALPSSTPCRTLPASRYRKLILLHCRAVETCCVLLENLKWGWWRKRPHHIGLHAYENQRYVEHDTAAGAVPAQPERQYCTTSECPKRVTTRCRWRAMTLGGMRASACRGARLSSTPW